MSDKSPKLFVEINKFELLYFVGQDDEKNEFKLIYSNKILIESFNEKKFDNLELILINLKDNIYKIEQKFNCIFKETILIIDFFENTFINCSGFKKLNGSQLTKQNIAFIINSLRAKINEIEKNKRVIHIFNSQYLLDKKRIVNLPIGLFGDFYSHELSFCLIKKNDLKNLENIFNKCNLRIKKIISKNFLNGINLINDIPGLENFIKVEIHDNFTKLILFENNSLKFVQEFKFGKDLIINDIAKITNLKNEIIKKILSKSNFYKEAKTDQIIEKEYFENITFRKIKKKLILDIADARIQEIAEILILKNINLNKFFKKKIRIFLTINDHQKIECLKESFLSFFSKKNINDVKIIEKIPDEKILSDVSNLVQFGWKSEAVPVVQEKKSIIARFFDLFFK